MVHLLVTEIICNFGGMNINRRKILAVAAVFAVACVAVVAVRAITSVSLKNGDQATLDNSPKIALAYVESFREGVPDARLFTHLVYAFAEFNDNCDGVVLPSPEKLKAMARLKKVNPNLKVILGVGGYKREGFSEMARDKKKRRAFVKSVKSIIDSIGLDGVDLDWEFPTTEAGGHTATPEDDRNYVLVVRDLRKSLGKRKWISFYSNNSASFIDFKRMVPYVDYVHVSGYNLAVPEDGKPAYHQSPLYPSRKLGGWCVKSVIERHMERGVPREKILMGIPFFGRGRTPFPSYLDCNAIGKYAGGMKPQWDDDAKAPYYADSRGNLVLALDDERSIREKMNFVRANNLPGVFVWNYDSDYPDHRLAKALK